MAHKGKTRVSYISSSDSDESSESDSSGQETDDSVEPPRVRLSLPPLAKARYLTAKSILDYVPISKKLSEANARVLDFGCGVGALSHHLAPNVDRIVGIDMNDRAVNEFNTRARNQGLDEDEMHAVVCNIVEESSLTTAVHAIGEVEVIVSAMCFHHLHNMALVTKLLVSRFLQKDGWIVVVDLMNTPYTSTIFENAKACHDHETHNSNEHAHHTGGIQPQEIREAFNSAGLRNVEVFEHVFEVPVMIPEKLLPLDYISSQASSSSDPNKNVESAVPSKIEVQLPFLMAVGQK